MNAVTVTDTTQVVAPPRWSVTVTRPSWPLIVLALLETTCDPSEKLVGTLIDRPPAVSWKVAVVGSAAAGRAVAATSVARALASRRN